jgi:hypothetical protein
VLRTAMTFAASCREKCAIPNAVTNHPENSADRYLIYRTPQVDLHSTDSVHSNRAYLEGERARGVCCRHFADAVAEDGIGLGAKVPEEGCQADLAHSNTTSSWRNHTKGRDVTPERRYKLRPLFLITSSYFRDLVS